MLSAHSIFKSEKKIAVLSEDDIYELSRVALQAREEAFAGHFKHEELEKMYDERYQCNVQAELSDRNIQYFVYKDRGKIFGFAKLIFLDDGICKLDKLYFLQKYHRQGFGKNLMQHCSEFAGQRGCHEMLLHAYHGNASAIAFYAALGFKQVGGLVDYVEPSNGEVYKDSNIVMQRNITQCEATVLSLSQGALDL